MTKSLESEDSKAHNQFGTLYGNDIGCHNHYLTISHPHENNTPFPSLRRKWIREKARVDRFLLAGARSSSPLEDLSKNHHLLPVQP